MAVRGQVRVCGMEGGGNDERLRHLANVPGRYYLDKWRDNRDKQISSFACRIQRISPRSVSLSAPVSGELGDLAVAHFDEFGVLRGPIVRRLGFGFVMSLDLGERERRRLAAKVLWLERRKNFAVGDMRRHRRVMPRSPQSTLVLADGTAIDCFVIDMSVSGAAVSANLVTQRGMPLALGTVVGRVVRHLDPGFAIEFIEPLAPEMLETRLLRRREDLCPD